MDQYHCSAERWLNGLCPICETKRNHVKIPGAAGSARKARSTSLRSTVLLVAIAGGEVEGDKSQNARSFCDVTGLTCSKMPPLCGNLRIRVKKRRLDEELGP